jgi:hypothetical protein
MQSPNSKPPLSIKIRVLIAIISLPSVVLAVMLGTLVAQGQAQDIGFMEVIYALVGFFALYMAISGKRYF